MLGTGYSGDLLCVLEPEATANRHMNPARSAADEAAQHRRAGEHIGSSTGSEDTMAAGGNDIFERSIQIPPIKIDNNVA